MGSARLTSINRDDICLPINRFLVAFDELDILFVYYLESNYCFHCIFLSSTIKVYFSGAVVNRAKV